MSNPKKSEARKLLEKENLVELLKQYTCYEIAEQFGTNGKIVLEVATEQCKGFDIANAFQRNQQAEIDKLPKEDDIVSTGAWNELKNSDIYKKLTNK